MSLSPRDGEVRAWAPGRVNLLGEHTDYSGGWVLPLALSQGTEVRARWRDDGRLVFRSTLDPEPVELDAGGPPPPRPGHWSNHLGGVLAEFWQPALQRGCELAVAGDLPLGAGLSSSASLGVACARALIGLLGAEADPLELALACQRAEQRHVGVQCGLMDQAAASLLNPGQALLLDCHTRGWRVLSLPSCALLVVHSGVRHELADSGYNQRVAECRRIRAALRTGGLLGERPLGQVTPAELPAARDLVDPALRPRLEHVVEENARARAGAACLERGELARFGALMFASHASLRERYQVSCPELDAIVEAARPLAHGAKMSGAGFGGAAVVLADPGALGAIEAVLPARARVLLRLGFPAPDSW